MLIQLSEGEIEAAGRHAQLNSRFPLLQAVIRRKQPGAVFADRRKEPAALAIVTRFGFMGVCGATDDPNFDSGIQDLLGRAGAIAPSYVLWYAPPAQWQDRLDRLGASVRRRERTRFKFNKDLADYLRREEPKEPGVELKALDASLLPAAAGLGLNLDSRFWPSAERLLSEGIGACAILNGQVASVCYSACVVDGLAESDVATVPDRQGRGLAGRAARAYITRCIRSGVEPTWDCFTENNASMALAEALGFKLRLTYPLYSFNVPLRFS